MSKPKYLVLAALLYAAASASAQMSLHPDYQGSVPQGTASATPIALSFEQAIDRGLKANLGFLTSEQSSREVRAQRARALSDLLPKVTGQTNAIIQQLKQDAPGFSR